MDAARLADRARLPTEIARRRARRRLPAPSPAAVVLWAIALFCALPFVWVLLAAFDPKASLYLQVPERVGGDNFVNVFTTSDTALLLLNSLIMSGGAVLLAVIVCTLGGYTLSRIDFPGRRALMFAVLLTRIIPPTATIVPLYVICLRLGLVDTYQGLILVLASHQVPLLLWMMKGFFDTVPIEIEEAAWLDGAGRIDTAFRIVLPLARPGAAAAALYAFIGAWGEFLTPLILISSPDRWPISVGLFRAYVAYTLVDYGKLAAMSLLYMLPSVVFFLLARRYLLRTTVAGALQGT